MSGKSDYRSDIDGLRAIAVLSVLCFHAFPNLLHGGFVGVDIFFVISGYLISKHIWEELATETYRIKTFYARRVRRIFPALAVVLVACLLMGWVILSPGEYEQLGKHITAGTLFVANIVFWKEAGYFDNAADTKPLLHLWSLGIEEQFYIVWPLLLAFFWRNTRFFAAGFLLVLGASLIYSIALVQHDVVADFYSPFSRFWELAVGAGVAYVVAEQFAIGNLQRTLIAWFGLFLIVIAFCIVQNKFLFPGAWALLPTLGAAGLIYAGEQAWPNRQLLAHPILAWFGLISYPLYLWHWPLLSFARIMQSETPSASLRIVLLAASILLAWLTYKFLERPVRAKPHTNRAIWVLCLTMVLLAVLGLVVKKTNGIKSRQLSMLNGDPATLSIGFDRDKLHHECGLPDTKKSDFQYCLSSGVVTPQLAIFGDSKAEALYYGLARESQADKSWLMIGTVYPPTLDATPNDKQQNKNRLAVQVLSDNHTLKVVVIAVALRGIAPVDAETGFITGNIAPGVLDDYSRMIGRLENAGKRVVWIIDNPTFPDPRSCISGGATSSPMLNHFLRRKENRRCTLRYADHLTGTRVYREFVAVLQVAHPSMIVYDPTPLLCDTAHDVCSVTQNGNFLYSYGDHISDYANSIIAKDLLHKLQAVQQ
ncbi:MAG: acyltransferase family protein [Gallionella sp.]